MTNYYFLSSMLPELQVGVPPELPFLELVPLLSTNLTEQDLKRVETVRRYYDLENIRAFWKGRPLSIYGNYSENDLEEALLTRSGFPEYVYDFIDRYQDPEDQLSHFSGLLSAYFREEIFQSRGFLCKYLRFEREWRLVLVGFRAKLSGKELGIELQYEDPGDSFIAQMLAQKDSKVFEPPEDYQELKALFEDKQQSPLSLYQALCAYRFAKLNDMMDGEVFTIDPILGYLCQLIIVEQWLELDKKKGLEIVDKIVRNSA